jgi:hypothetical protein
MALGINKGEGDKKTTTTTTTRALDWMKYSFIILYEQKKIKIIFYFCGYITVSN